MRRLVAVALTALLTAVLSGCGDDAGAPGAANVDVATPELVAMKAEAGIEDCRPGPGGGELPELTLRCLGGGPDVDLADLTGPLVINLWFSGCAPCRDEMPALQAFYAEHGDTVDLLGIDVEIYPDLALSFADIVGATYPQLADPAGEVLDLAELRVPGFPQLLFIDDDGALVHQMGGGVETEAEVVELVETHLGVDL